ncbi:hypothetical protein DMENIID0001_031470 [Sergentomyia squamirostris]
MNNDQQRSIPFTPASIAFFRKSASRAFEHQEGKFYHSVHKMLLHEASMTLCESTRWCERDNERKALQMRKGNQFTLLADAVRVAQHNHQKSPQKGCYSWGRYSNVYSHHHHPPLLLLQTQHEKRTGEKAPCYRGYNSW